MGCPAAAPSMARLTQLAKPGVPPVGAPEAGGSLGRPGTCSTGWEKQRGTANPQRSDPWKRPGLPVGSVWGCVTAPADGEGQSGKAPGDDANAGAGAVALRRQQLPPALLSSETPSKQVLEGCCVEMMS